MSVQQLDSTATPINLLPGSVCVQVPGKIHADKTVSFTMKAESGQVMVLNGRPVTDNFAINGVVVFPSGQQDGGPGDGIFFARTLTETGLYTIQISVRHMVTDLKDGSFVLEVVILPSGII